MPQPVMASFIIAIGVRLSRPFFTTPQPEIVMTQTSDELFRRERGLTPDFDFSEKTAEVFDDMLDRSVPFCSEIQRIRHVS